MDISNGDLLECSLKCSQCSDKSCDSMVLDQEDLALLSRNCSDSRFLRGEPILKQGSLTSHIIYLKSGLVKEFSTNESGQDNILQIIKRHTYLGLPSLFGDKLNHYSYTALTDVTLCNIDVNTFKHLILKNGRFSYEILSTVSRESLNNYHRLVNTRQKQISGKIADTLLYLARVIFNDNTFDLPLNRIEIANMIGSTRESVTKQLKEFTSSKLIRIEGHTLTLLDVDKLERISKFG
ncbi:MAG: Crp/Fnr family transcriptional regulator [Bacteroidales bacterium]